MVIKKPYAFLIRNFRLIHAVLFGLLLFIAVQSFGIYTFFSNYVKSHSFYATDGLANSYVPTSIFVVIVVAILVTFLIYYILSKKQKSNRAYLFIFMYCIVLFVYFIYVRSVFVGLEDAQMGIESSRAMRDISIIVMLPQIITLFILLGRTLGFNLKQFDFKKDLEEMEIDVSDNEEIEVSIGNDTYKIARFFRKVLRLSKYFVLENKLFVIGLTSVIVLCVSFVIVSKLNVTKESYSENDLIKASSLHYKVNNSYITQVDKDNIMISYNRYYILVDVSITNNTKSSKLITRDTFRLKIGNESFLPSFTYAIKFSDVGDIFSPFELKPGDSVDKIVVFEIKSQDLANEYLFKISNLESYEENDQFKDIYIKPIYLNESKNKGTYTIPNEIKLNDTLLKDSIVHISSFEFGEKFKEEFVYTFDNNEKKGVYSVIPDSTNKGELIILKIKGNIKIDDSVYMSKYIKYPADFFEQYGVIRYRYQGNYKTVKLKKINVNYNKDNYSYLEVTKEVSKANKIEFIILIRGVKYTFNLK